MSRIVPYHRSPLHLIYTALSLILPIAFTVAPLARAASNQNKKPAVDNTAEEAPQAAADSKPEAKAAKSDDKPSSDDLGEAQLVRIRLPLTGNADDNVISAVQRVVDDLTRHAKPAGRRPTLVLELAPKRGTNGEGTDFTRALKVANFLTSPAMSAVKTVAYIPHTIKGHGVLVALACEKIAIAPEADLGEATIDADASRPVDPNVVSAYTAIIEAKRTLPLAVALGMVDRRLEVLKVETDSGTEYALNSELEALKKKHTIISQDVLKPAGALGSFTGRDGRDFGVLLTSDVDSLARGLGVGAAALKQDQSMLGNWRPVRIQIEGPITRRKVHQIKTMLGEEISKRKFNWIGFTIDSEGGRLEDCKELADTIANLNASEVQTVAYVPVDAAGGAALIALACDQLVMQPESHVGGRGTVPIDRPTLDDARESIRDSLSKKVPHSWSLLTALIDPSIDLFAYQNTKSGEVRYFSSEEAKTQPDADNWRRGARVKPAGEALRMTANQAKELGVATHVVDNFDDLKQAYGIEGDIRVAQPNWALEFIEALSSPGLAVLLIVIGFVGVYVELHSPGVGIGAFIAAVAFLLFFWSHFLNGTAEWLEVLLFLGGIFCILIEVLVLPGLAIFGLGGGAMILASLVLATQTFILPRTESQMIELRHSLSIVATATLIVIAASIALRRYLPSAPVFRKLLLNPPPEEELMDLEYRESLADFSHLLGQEGTAATNLMPAGKAEFNGQLVDVIADGLPIDRGAKIVVVKTRGNRVLVHALDS
ncbi:MAG TPA: NfeD family protein [Lacipirellulaceae bacterium]|nr:NfeD family protein [Lacipirellulaceae bacterium]